MAVSEIISSLAALGVGTMGGAAVRGGFGRGESKATAANLLVDSAGSFVDRLARDNEHLDDANKKLRAALRCTTKAIDLLVPYVNAPPDILRRAQDACDKAKYNL